MPEPRKSQEVVRLVALGYELTPAPKVEVNARPAGDLNAMLQEEIEKVTRDTDIPAPIKQVVKSSGVVTEYRADIDTRGKPEARNRSKVQAPSHARKVSDAGDVGEKSLSSVPRGDGRRSPNSLDKPPVRSVSRTTPGVVSDKRRDVGPRQVRSGSDEVRHDVSAERSGGTVEPRMERSSSRDGSQQPATDSGGGTPSDASEEAGLIRGRNVAGTQQPLDHLDPIVTYAMAAVTMAELEHCIRSMQYTTVDGGRTVFDDCSKLMEQMTARIKHYGRVQGFEG